MLDQPMYSRSLLIESFLTSGVSVKDTFSALSSRNLDLNITCVKASDSFSHPTVFAIASLNSSTVTPLGAPCVLRTLNPPPPRRFLPLWAHSSAFAISVLVFNFLGLCFSLSVIAISYFQAGQFNFCNFIISLLLSLHHFSVIML